MMNVLFVCLFLIMILKKFLVYVVLILGCLILGMYIAEECKFPMHISIGVLIILGSLVCARPLMRKVKEEWDAEPPII